MDYKKMANDLAVNWLVDVIPWEINEAICDAQAQALEELIASALHKAVSEERAACAQIADDWVPGDRENWENASSGIAAAIRARGEKGE